MLVYVLALVAALLFAFGSVIQQRAASTAPPEKALSFALLWFLVRQREWLVGLASSLGGNGLSSAAIGMGGVALAQPLFTARLLFALGLSAAFGRLRVPRRDWLAGLMTAGGLALFVAIGHPGKGHPLRATTLEWAPAVAGVAVLVAVLVVVSKRQVVTRAAFSLAAAGGLLFGLQSALTETSIALLRHHGLGAFLHWQPYILIGAALYGAVVVQSAYEMAPLPASFPALVTVEPITGIAIGVTVLHGSLRVSPLDLLAAVGGLAIMVGGVALLARSPLVTGQLAALERRREEGVAYRTAGQLERLLAETEGAVEDLGRSRRRPRHERDRCVAEAGSQLHRLEELIVDMTRLRNEEIEELRRLPPRERMMLACLEQELDERQAKIEEWTARLQGDFQRLR